MDEKVIAVVARARDILSERWCQRALAKTENPYRSAHVHSDEAVQFCSIGGIERAVYELYGPLSRHLDSANTPDLTQDEISRRDERDKLFLRTVKEVEDALGVTRVLKERRSLIEWNDRRGQKQERVVKHFDKVLRKLQREARAEASE